MAAYPAPKVWTVDEFLEWERAQEDRYEYVGGVIRMMVGGTNRHSRITFRLAVSLHSRLQGRHCEVFSEGPKIKVEWAAMYPDVLVTCGQVSDRDDTVADPVLIAEVLSPSTAGHDAVTKWEAYRTIVSLQHYVLVAQDACAIDVLTRDGDGWRLVRYDRMEQVLPLTALGIEVPLAEIYEGSSVARSLP